MEAKQFVLRLKHISKLFGVFRALDDVHLDIVDGSIHAILGENGAGKTTLMNILYGLYRPDRGRIELRGRETVIQSPRKAMEMGIGMIHQHFMLVETLTVVENVVLGLPNQGICLSLNEHTEKLSQLSDELGFDIDPHTEIQKLPIGMRQRVEILKVLYRDAEVVIFDEPTSVLAPNEIANFLEGLDRLRESGKTIIFITHKLEEVMAIGDRITILRHGKVIVETDVAETTAREMARMMVGRDVVLNAMEKSDGQNTEVVVSARNLRALGNRGTDALKGVSFELHAGEILGVAGVDGNGQAELAEVVTGIRKLESGSLTINGENVTGKNVYDYRHKIYMSFVPEDRHGTGLVLDFSVSKNAMLRDYKEPPFSKNGILKKRKIDEITREWVERYDVRLQSLDQSVRFLSGGNQQKLIFAREVECDPRIIVVMQPCKGLDVGAIEAVQCTMLAQREKGKAILYISTEIEHILAVCDRVAVMCAGEITGILSPEEATGERIGTLMGGIREMGAA